MLDTSVLSELSEDACAAISGARDAALLHAIEAAHLFLVPVDEERTRFPVPPPGAPDHAGGVAGQGPGAERMLRCGRQNISSPPVTCGALPATSWRRGRTSGHWLCCVTGS